MDKEELQNNTQNHDDIVPEIKDTTKINKEGYVNEGFHNSNEELIGKEQEENKPSTSEEINNMTENPIIHSLTGYINEAFDDVLQTASTENETGNKVHLRNGAESQTLNNTKVDDTTKPIGLPVNHDDNKKTIITLEENERKRKIDLKGWDRCRTTMFFITFLAFDAWAAAFYCMKNNIIKDILNN